MTVELDDTALMLRYRDGDIAAFEALYRRHRGALYRFIQRQVSSSASADDLFQEVWSRIIGSRSTYRASARFSTYLYRIARNCLIDHYRRSGSEAAVIAPANIDAAATSGPGPGQSAEAAETRAALQAALNELSLEQREAFLLRAEGGLTLDEIAAVSDVGRETVKSRLRYALKRLRQLAQPLAPTAAADDAQ